MRGRWMGLALVVAVGASPAFADNARPRGGGSSGGGGGGHAGASHHSGGGSSGHSGGGSGGHHSSGGGGGHVPSGAALRHPRAGTGHGYGHYGHYGHYPYYGYGYGYPYYPYYGYGYGYGPYWGGYWSSPYYWGGWGGYGYGDGYGGDAYSHGYDSDSGAIRTFVEPLKTKVFVDGRMAGTADDFDGLGQRLYVSPGAHELVLSLDGYKTHRVKAYVPPGGTLKLYYDMVKGSGEDAVIDTLGNPEDEQYGQRQRRYRDDDDADVPRDEVREHRSPDDAPPPPPARDRGEGSSSRPGFYSTSGPIGTVRLSIQPGDASIYVDGRFRGPADGLRALRLTPGTHHIEAVRPGFRTVERDVDVREDEDTTLELELTRS